MSALDCLLGASGDPMPTECKIVVPGQIEVHWYPNATPGMSCFCGANTQKDPGAPQPIWHTTPRLRKGHLLVEWETAEGAAITLCARRSRPDDVWTEDPGLAVDERCGQCRRRYEAGQR